MSLITNLLDFAGLSKLQLEAIRQAGLIPDKTVRRFCDDYNTASFTHDIMAVNFGEVDIAEMLGKWLRTKGVPEGDSRPIALPLLVVTPDEYSGRFVSLFGECRRVVGGESMPGVCASWLNRYRMMYVAITIELAKWRLRIPDAANPAVNYYFTHSQSLLLPGFQPAPARTG